MTLLKSLALAGAALASVAVAHAAPAPASFARCAACHNATKDAGPKIGPDLWGVYGRKAASAKFNYSAALKAQKITWNDAALDKWLTGPMQMVPGTMMSFPGLKDPAKRAEIIAYLKTLH
ncbi:cytochrome c, class I [Novosphingobium nitrogenifigens DSM 19370]|uniref:Cytochrome c, class I n=1 Tax=Novosphingobium nitrogenifigens DSM 19370 TaxID=983920 RepID=F1ZB00_9SPHN|nr:c-type cytochrome [Novosphingobium nitrogenifigens]EGD58222.1 cytochrome c, class I [Novosphingobium nitrogenifigens DSM 19370]